MARKESPKVKEKKSVWSRVGVSAASPKVLGIVEIILGAALLPFVYGVTVAFGRQLFLIPKPAQAAFAGGVGVFLAVHFFIWEPEEVYFFGQDILTRAFGNFKHIVNIAPYFLPVYSIAVFVVYELIAIFRPVNSFLLLAVFLLGFTGVLHLVFAARALRSKGDDFLKGDYIFGAAGAYIISFMFLSLFLGVMVKGFSFVNFCAGAYSLGAGVFAAVFRQLFVPRA